MRTSVTRLLIRSMLSLMLGVMLLVGLTSMISGSSKQDAFAHKPLEDSEDANRDLQNALFIPDHKISWAIYQNLEQVSLARFYTFEGKANEELYAQISIPALDGLEEFSPHLAILGPEIPQSDVFDMKYAEIARNTDLPFHIPSGMSSISFSHEKGSNPQHGTFYEPFTQTSYWTRQEVRVNLPKDGEYFLVVYAHDVKELRASSKFTLAVGEIEDFGPIDFIAVLPSAWIKTKLFFEQPAQVVAVMMIPSGIAGVLIIRKILSTTYGNGKKPPANGQR